MRTFKPNTYFHVEDDEDWRELVYLHLETSLVLTGNTHKLKRVKSSVSNELSPEALEAEVERLAREAGEERAYLEVQTGQVARGYFSRFLPATIISDTGFPLNGAKTVQWMLEHGLQEYPLIGLSATDVRSLPEDVKHFFLQTNARYFDKCDLDKWKKIIPQVEFNVDFVLKNYSRWLVNL